MGAGKTAPYAFVFFTDIFYLKGRLLGNRAVIKRHVDPDIFKAYIESRGVTLRQLGSLCESNEKTLRRMLKDQEVTLTVALDLCRYFDCDFNTLFGPDDSPSWRASVITILKKVR